MRILFVHPPHTGFDRAPVPKLTYSIPRIPPLSGITLASYVREHGHDVAVIDGQRISIQHGNDRAHTYQEIARQARKFNPDAVAITILTADVPEATRTLRLLRSISPNATIVGGGPHPSGEPIHTLKQMPELDAIGIGPGEEICLDLANGKPVSETSGCAFLNDKEIVLPSVRRRTTTDIDSFPFPAWDLIDGKFYSELNHATTFGVLTRSLGVVTSRGCPGHCYFCSSEWNRPLRMHSVQYVLDLCEYLLNRYPIDTIAFWDDTLGMDRRRLERICEGILARGLHRRMKWRAMLRADQIEFGLLKLMKDANCFCISFGVESGNGRILKLLNKRVTVDQNLAAAEAVKRAGLLLGISVMLGVPTETEEEMMDTINFCKQVECDYIGVGRFCPLPGSPSYVDLVKQRRIDPATVDWEQLGNFTLLEGPCFANIDPRRFRKILYDFNDYCNAHYRVGLVRNNAERFPDIVRLCVHGESAGMRNVKKLVPIRLRRIMKGIMNLEWSHTG